MFRAVSKNNKKQWIYGSLTPDNHISTRENRLWMKNTPIIPETIGEYSGCRDINNVRIFENDIVYIEEDKEYGTVKFQDSMFIVILEDGSGLALGTLNGVRVIGNSYELR